MFTASLVLTAMGFALDGLLGVAARVFSVGEENSVVEEINDLLPQSQCGQCGFPGCRSAAEAMVNGEAEVTCCPPGGQSLAESLAALLGIDINLIGQMAAPSVARIVGEQCTGCTRCYKVCPTDAIVGANKQIHAVIDKACTGCGKCVDACPENCVALVPESESLDSWHWPKPVLA